MMHSISLISRHPKVGGKPGAAEFLKTDFKVSVYILDITMLDIIGSYIDTVIKM